MIDEEESLDRNVESARVRDSEQSVESSFETDATRGESVFLPSQATES